MKNSSTSIFCIVITILFSFNVFAQETGRTVQTSPIYYFNYDGSWTADSIEVLQYYSLYREFFKQGAIEEALPYWRFVVNHAPKFRKSIYKDGWNMYEQMAVAADDTIVHKAYIDSMLLMYDTYMELFGEVGKLSAWKSLKVKKYLPHDKELYKQLILNSVDISQENAPYYVLVPYLEIKRKKNMWKEYEKLSKIAKYNIEKGGKFADRYEQVQQIMDGMTALICHGPRLNCPDIIAKYKPQYTADPNDLNFLKSFLGKLNGNRCTSETIYLELRMQLFELEPTAVRARRLAAYSYKEGKVLEACNYFLQSIELESDDTTKAKTYMNLATIERKKSEELTEDIAIQARKYALKAAELQAGWGKPWMFIGDLYASSGKLCGSGTGWESQRVAWAATDMWLKAKDIDPDVTSEANQSINKYSAFYPTVSEGFMRGGTKNGDRVSLNDCWIGGSTTARLK